MEFMLEENIEIDLSSLESGVYLLKFSDNRYKSIVKY